MEKKFFFSFLSLLLLFIFVVGCQQNTLGEAWKDRSFQAEIVEVKATQHPPVRCPQLKQFSHTKEVTRITFDREVLVWSENGTGDGQFYPTRSVDITATLLPKTGKGVRNFHYSLSFLSVCDKSRIPVISKFR